MRTPNPTHTHTPTSTPADTHARTRTRASACSSHSPPRGTSWKVTDRSGTPLGGGTGTSDAVAGERAVFRVTRIGAAAADDVRDLRAVVRSRNCGHGRAVCACVCSWVCWCFVCVGGGALCVFASGGGSAAFGLRFVRQIRSPSGKETRVELVPAAGGADGAYALRSTSFV
jgi:hypothetical protein